MRNLTRWLLSVLLAVVTAQAQAYSAMYVFGDSLSDDGNNQAFLVNFLGLPATVAPYQVPGSSEPLVPTTPYVVPAGTHTYSNGPVWVDYLADSLGLPLIPFAAGGTNYAYGGARTGDLGLGDGNGDMPFSLRVQVGLATGFPPAPLPGEALYVVWGGGNDIRALGAQLGPKLADPLTRAQAEADLVAGIGAGINNLGSILNTLTNAGARNFLIPNVPDIGITPIARFLEVNGQPGTMDLLTKLSFAFDESLVALLAPLKSNPLFNITTLNVFKFNHDVLANAAPGYNATEACTSQNAFTACSNPENFLYWDGVHPTTASHRAIAALALTALQPVPLPAPLPLAVGGVVVLLGLARRRRAA